MNSKASFSQPLRISIIVPARNEEHNIAACLQSLLAQGDDIEILVADDGSQDSTARIVLDLAESHPQLRLLAVPPLPEGWVGKNHALAFAVGHAHGDWFLFTDADTRHEPDKLREVLAEAMRDGLDWISLSPRQEVHAWWERATIPLIFRSLARLYPFHRVNDPADPLAASNGQYILVRREVYFALGGHAAVRNEILEDVELATRAKQAGHRIRFRSGRGVVSTRMYSSIGQMWEGWTKNLFLLFRRDTRAMSRARLRLAFRIIFPLAAGLPLCISANSLANTIGIFLLLLLAWEHFRYARELDPGERLGSVPLLIPGAVLFFLLLWRSERLHRHNLGVSWKGRHYRTPTQ